MDDVFIELELEWNSKQVGPDQARACPGCKSARARISPHLWHINIRRYSLAPLPTPPPTLTHHISTRHNHPNTQPTAHHYRHNCAPTTPTQDIEIEIRALPDDMSKLIPDFIDRTLAKLLTLVVRCAELRVEFDSAWGLIVLWVGSVWSCVYVAGPHRAGSQRECETCRGLRCAAAVLGGAGSGQLLGCSSSKQPASKPTLPTLRSPALCPLR